jgi:hypothetical protein
VNLALILVLSESPAVMPPKSEALCLPTGAAVSTFEFFYYLMLFGSYMLSRRCHPNGSHSEDVNTKSRRFAATLFARLNFAPDRD